VIGFETHKKIRKNDGNKKHEMNRGDGPAELPARIVCSYSEIVHSDTAPPCLCETKQNNAMYAEQNRD
jgi:hypothetical protein